MAEENLKQTPLFDYYVEKGLKLTDFGGWALPIQFTKIQEEHDAVRQTVGIFEVSHMGEILIKGSNVLEWFNQIITNDTQKISINDAQYTAIVNEDGYTLDDLIYYYVAENTLFVTPNAGNKDKILAWLNQHNSDNTVEIIDQSAEYGLIAVQGPNSEKVLKEIAAPEVLELNSFQMFSEQTVAGVDSVRISKTGYTGELGYELYIPWAQTAKVWEALLNVGESYGLKECGLGARDTLRLEAGMALYGNDLSEEITPIEGGIAFAVDLNKENFIGKEALEKVKNDPNRYMSRGFELTGKGIARQGYKIFESEESTEVIGEVTSGTKSPTFKKALGFAQIRKPYAKINNQIFIEIRNKRVPAIITKKDWLKNK
ncbi:glycine cleavage system aminomethyltransferase GcvT [Ruoffia tabacinasalis]|uniref:glycine cleavage system aminomethyltransferase GcvT n=1 Tax=Ruoffia tabacinasalis TaxID=87458 RepID=UPI003F97D274